MTQARTHTKGFGTPPLIQLWLEAVLCAFVRLVQGVGATLGMRFNQRLRDWHTNAPQEALPQSKPGIHIKDPTPPTESFSAPCRESLLAPTRGFTNDPRNPINRDPRHKPEDDTGDDASSHPKPILQDDRRFAPIPQDEGCGCRHDSEEALMGEQHAKRAPVEPRGRAHNSLPLIPTNVGIQGGPKDLSRLAASGLFAPHNRSWMPTFVGMSGTG